MARLEGFHEAAGDEAEEYSVRRDWLAEAAAGSSLAPNEVAPAFVRGDRPLFESSATGKPRSLRRARLPISSISSSETFNS
jgi:hypothetical protein